MIDLIKKLFNKYRSLILYAVFGVMTTVVNIVVYWVCAHPLGMSTVISSAAAWVLAVLFAYLTNRKWVFDSQAHGMREIVREIISFFACRVATGLLDLAIMWFFVDVLHWNDMIIKIASNVIVIILNFILSKFLVFAKRKSGKE